MVEYSGQARIGKTKHGTKHSSLKAVNRDTLHNGLCALSEYFPVSVTYAQAMTHLVSKANATLLEENRIRKLSFDRAGWDAELLLWLQDEAGVMPVTWVKRTPCNVKLFAEVEDHAFVAVDEEVLLGKKGKQHVVKVADTTLEFPHLGPQRVIVLETDTQKRIGLYTSAPRPQEPLSDPLAMDTAGLMDTMRDKQRIENRFKVERNEMDADAIPTHQTHKVTRLEPYDLDDAQKQLGMAHKRFEKHTANQQQKVQLQEAGALNKHELNRLQKRSQRLCDKAENEVKTLSHEIASIQYDHNGQPVLATDIEVLDVRKLTLLNLFKLHALVALKILARRLGLPEAGPERLRRSFLAFGDRVEFDHDRQIATVYAHPFPRAQIQNAFAQLCSELLDEPIFLPRNGVNYRVQFACHNTISEHGNNDTRPVSP